MNTVDVRGQAARLSDAARALRSIGSSIERIVAGLEREWQGPEFARFKGWWTNEHRRTLHQLVDSIEGLVRSARHNAEEQERASGASGSPWSSSQFGSNQRINSGRIGAGLIAIETALDAGGRGVRRDDLLAIQEVFSNLNDAEKNLVVEKLTNERLALLKDQMQESGAKGGLTAQQQAVFLGPLLAALEPDQSRRLMGKEWALIRHATPDQIAASSSGRELVAGLFDGLRHRPIASDEIEIRTLDGSYIVMLPGVRDLSEGLKGGAVRGVAGGGGINSVVAASAAVARTWESTNTSDSARDMHYARQSEMQGHNGSELGTNGYAFAVKQAMRAANIPDGANVMLVGHSFGAYTAAELASDKSFNDAFGEPRLGYSVNITHVAAAGATAGFRMNELPGGTEGVLVNNSGDLAYRLERFVPTNNESSASEIVFDGGSHDGAGHQPTHHGAFVRSADNPMLNDFNGSAFDRYGGSGSAVRVTVKDPFR